ncbi:PRP24 [Candida pseudojiufengensis]|uniref:PRP24 n=1 Tax=Candida pseudojiufengensis TaxID=497109 RepID=UPI0022253CEE|nr:PRP24 [Candida pseudojiufengensis]KAI5966829.1 PRP24 [Candida pseudojiufengensis]
MSDDLKRIDEEFDLLINENCYALENYDKILSKLLVLSNRSEIVNKVYTEKIKHFKLRQSELNNWLFEIRSIIDEEERSRLEYKFYELIIDDYATVPIWSSWLRLAKELNSNRILSDEDYRALIFRSLYTCGNDFATGHIIWDWGLDYFYQNFLGSNDSTDLNTLVKLHLKRLGIPSTKLDESFQEFSSLISNHKSQSYDELIQAGNEIYTSAKKKSSYYEKYESQIVENSKLPEVWIEYMESVWKYSTEKNLASIQAIFARSNQDEVSFSNNRQQVWMAFLNTLYSSQDTNPKVITQILENYVRTFPNSCSAYAESIKNCIAMPSNGNTVYNALNNRINMIDLKNSVEYNDWKKIPLASIQFKFQKVNADDDMESLEVLLDTSVEDAIKNNDEFHSVEKLAVLIYKKRNQVRKAMNVIESLFSTFSTEAEVWIYGLQTMVEFNIDFPMIRGQLKKALSFELDNPEKLIDQWLRYEQVYGDLNSYRQTTVSCNSWLEKLQRQKSEKVDVPVERKRNHDIAEKSHRSREEFSVQVNNLPLDITKTEIEKFFNDCGEIKDINIIHYNDEKQAVIEFSNELEVFSAITRNHKILGSNEIRISRVEKTLLFVNNYPSTLSQLQVREIFESFGPVVSIRFPSQAKNKIRRFCYVQFLRHEDAQNAINLFDGRKYNDENLNNKELTWEVKYSMPQERKERTTPMSERKIRITNIAFSITEEELRKEFSEFGEIDSISLPKAIYDTKKRKMKQNGGIAIITFQNADSVDDSLSKDGFLFKNRPIKVTKQQPPINYTPDDFDELKTIGLIHLNPSLNQYQIKNHLENNYGKVNKIMLLPDLNSALIEFQSVKDSGRVGLNGGSIIIDNFSTQVTTKQDVTKLINFTASKPTSSSDMVPSNNAKNKYPMIPTSIKRRKT